MADDARAQAGLSAGAAAAGWRHLLGRVATTMSCWRAPATRVRRRRRLHALSRRARRRPRRRRHDPSRCTTPASALKPERRCVPALDPIACWRGGPSRRRHRGHGKLWSGRLRPDGRRVAAPSSIKNVGGGAQAWPPQTVEALGRIVVMISADPIRQ